MKKIQYKNSPILGEHFLKVSDIHTLHIQERGNKNGIPVIFLHGGPGGSFSEKSTYFFDPRKYYLVLFSQRGCGKSTPHLETKENNIFELVEDIEKIRKYLKIDKFYAFGGSFGSTLGLAYAIKYPKNLLGLIIRSIFLGRQEDVDWLYQEGASYYYPEMYDKYVSIIPEEKRYDILSAYYDIFNSDDIELKNKAALLWSNWETSVVFLKGAEKYLSKQVTDSDRELALLECVFFKNHTFLGDDNYILDNIHKAKDVPTWILHGRYDIDCRPSGAYDLVKKMPWADFKFVHSGHASSDINMYNAIVDILDNKIK